MGFTRPVLRRVLHPSVPQRRQRRRFGSISHGRFAAASALRGRRDAGVPRFDQARAGTERQVLPTVSHGRHAREGRGEVRPRPAGRVRVHFLGGRINRPRRPGARVRHAGHRGRDGEPSLPLRKGVGGRFTHASLVRLSQVVRGRPRVRYQPAVRVSTRVHLLQRRRRQ